MPNNVNEGWDAAWHQWINAQPVNPIQVNDIGNDVQAQNNPVEVHPVPNGGGLIEQIEVMDPFVPNEVSKYYKAAYKLYGEGDRVVVKDASYEQRLKKEKESKIKIMNNFGITEKEVDLLLENKSIESVLIKLNANRSNIFPVNIVIKSDDLGCTGLLIGYIYENKFYNDSIQLDKDTFKEIYKVYPEGDKIWGMHSPETIKSSVFGGNKGVSILKQVIKPVMLVLDNNKPKIYTKHPYYTKFVYRELGTASSLDLIKKVLSIRITDSKLSSKIYGNENKKAELIGKVISPDNYTIASTKSKKLENNAIQNFIVPIEGGEGKFVLQDIEFVIPTLVGYNFPKDKSLNEGTIVKVIKDINPVLRKGTEGRIVRFVKVDENSKRLCKNSTTRQLDVISINVSGRLHKIYAKYLKSIC